MRLSIVVVGALVAGLLVAPAPAGADSHVPACRGWRCGLEAGGPGEGTGGGGSGGWAVWTSRIYTALETTDRTGAPCVMAYPDGGDLTGPEVLAQIESAWQDYTQALERYEQDLEERRHAERAVERAQDARDDARQARDQAQQARDQARAEASASPDDAAALDRWAVAEAAVAAAQARVEEAEDALAEALAAFDALPVPQEPEQPLPACGGGSAEAAAQAPEPQPRIEPGSALTGITSYLEIDLDDLTDDGTFETTLRLLGREFVLEATPRFTVEWGDGQETDTPHRGEPYPGGPEEITHTYSDAGLVDVVVRATWTATLREVGGDLRLDLDTVTTTGTLEDFPVQQAQAVRVR